jgi:tRNA dimethylallyltransferase
LSRKRPAASFPVVFLVGPTGCGKTDAALALSRRLPAEMISCDSMQVYRGMRIVSQAPGPDVTRRLKTHLVGFLGRGEEYSAARFREDAERLIGRIRARGRVPLVVGGTGLYVRALLDGLFEPEGAQSDPDLRRRLAQEAAEAGPGHLHARLVAVDAAAARRIHPNDTRRLVRALEVYLLTGKPLSQLQPLRAGLRGRAPFRLFLIDREREDLYRRIDARVDAMLEAGLVREVRRVRSGTLGKTAGVALGLREIGGFLDGHCSLAEAVETLKRNTRRYAKRQLSWFRHERGIERVPARPADAGAAVARRVMAELERP